MAYADIAGTEVQRRNVGGTGRFSVMRNDVSDGPMRWERARLWAEQRPNTQAAKLYRKRRDTALAVVSDLSDYPADSGLVFTRKVGYSNTIKRTYMCSIECAAMRAQLDAHDKTPSGAISQVFRAALEGAPAVSILGSLLSVSRLDRRVLPREVKCRVCGVKVLPQAAADKATLDEHTAATETPAPTQPQRSKYVLIDGQLEPISTVRVVTLTDDQVSLLREYSTPDLRAAYVSNYGHPLAEEV